MGIDTERILVLLYAHGQPVGFGCLGRWATGGTSKTGWAFNRRRTSRERLLPLACRKKAGTQNVTNLCANPTDKELIWKVIEPSYRELQQMHLDQLVTETRNELLFGRNP